MTQPLSIELPEPLRRHVEQRAAAAGFGTAGDFVRDLIERDRDATSRLEFLLLEALEDQSEPIEVDDAFWQERRSELARRIAERKPV